MNLKFWEKDRDLGSAPGDGKDPLGLNNPISQSGSFGDSSNNSFGSSSNNPLPSSFDSPSSPQTQMPSQDTFQNPVFQENFSSQNTGNPLERDISLLNAKLDAIKAMIDSMNQRIMNIERIANESQTPKQTQPQRPPTQQYRW